MSKIKCKVEKAVYDDVFNNYWKHSLNFSNENVLYLKINNHYKKSVLNNNNNNNNRTKVVYINSLDRMRLNITLDDFYEFEILSSSFIPKCDYFDFDLISLKTGDKINITDDIKGKIISNLTGTIINSNSEINIYINGINYILKIKNILTQEVKDTNSKIFDFFSKTKTNNNEINKFGIVDIDTIIISEEKNLINLKNLDFESIGVGGLNDQFKNLLKNIFLTRIIPKNFYENLGINHVKGAIIYGPPGCGKTKLARNLGNILGIKNIKFSKGKL